MIQNSATVAQNVQDICDAFHISAQQVVKEKQNYVTSDISEEQDMVKILENGALHFDKIVRKMGKDSYMFGNIMSMMESKRMMKSGEGKFNL